MFQAFYRLNENPFSNEVSSSNLFLSEHHREALTCLNYGLNETGGFVLLTGEEGSGKTSVVKAFLKQVSTTHDTAFITNPSISEHELLAKVCNKLNIPYEGTPSLKCFTDLLCQFLLNNDAQGRSTLVIIDEAQYLSSAVLEQLRLLTNLETDTKKLLQLILVGRPELIQMLRQEELRQVSQRITARLHIPSLSQSETSAYIQHHLRVAGHHDPLFAPAALKAVHRYSGGRPSMINQLCEQALMIGHAQSKNTIDSSIISTAVSQIPAIKIKPRNDRSLFATLSAMAVATVAVLMILTLTLTHSVPKKPTDRVEQETMTETAMMAGRLPQEQLALDGEESSRLKERDPIAAQNFQLPPKHFNEAQGAINAEHSAVDGPSEQEKTPIIEQETEHALIAQSSEMDADAKASSNVDRNQSTKPLVRVQPNWYVLQIYAGRARPDDITKFHCENINLLIRHHNETYYLTSEHLTLPQAKQTKRLMTEKCQIDTWIKPLPKGWQALVASQN
ncbi:Type II secretory pathway component ExeA (predicted ATPase)-like protein [Shewanella sediminis HAW-EB3]|uniref:Type II secretory pathway component ExeA (Predicted ATPase)-like protein n=1 Tax=Shewanella sediminis (strain HAW-EB3) TaxID=425104 RepID=A8FTV9_SHESH|nr:AAA family ATPase [Shewanella sediminis]ABV36282.1 Type II secretory pathway component ExeA (predicted ATPase)-like protein [Shewanella sediminis HAW-EB3]